MKLNFDNVPENNYFTKSELAERWNCNIEKIDHFIYERKILRLAINLNKQYLIKLSKNPSEESLKLLIKFVQHTDTFLSHNEENESNTIDADVDQYRSNKELKRILGQISFDDFKKVDKYPQFIYEDIDHVCAPLKYFSEEWGISWFSAYISAVDINDNVYVFIDPDFRRISAVRNYEFDTITREERDRFEKEYEISDSTKNVQQLVSAKTENKYLEVIKALSEGLIGQNLSDHPHSDVNAIDRELALKGMKLPCTKETLAKYLGREK